MRKLVLAAAVLIAFLLDAAVFPSLGFVRRTPDMLIAVFVSLSVLTGFVPAVPLAAAVGLLFDMGFKGFIGASAIPLFAASLAGAMFYSRFYADNLIVPSAVAAAAALFKELFLLIVMLASGGKTSGLFALVVLHILPAALFTGAVCALVHLFFKKKLLRSSFRRDIDYLRRDGKRRAAWRDYVR